MNYRKENYNVDPETGKTVTEGQTFDQFYQKFRLNSATNELEEDGVVDIQEMINSNLESCLTRVIERYLPNDDVDDAIGEYEALRDNLDYMYEAGNVAEDLKERYGLDPSLSMSQVYEEVNKRASAMKKDIDAKIQAHSGTNKEPEVQNEKEAEQKSE